MKIRSKSQMKKINSISKSRAKQWAYCKEELGYRGRNAKPVKPFVPKVILRKAKPDPTKA